MMAEHISEHKKKFNKLCSDEGVLGLYKELKPHYLIPQEIEILDYCIEQDNCKNCPHKPNPLADCQCVCILLKFQTLLEMEFPECF